MSTTIDAVPTDDVVAVGPPRRRRNSWVLAGVLIAVLGGLVALWLVSATSKTTRIVVAASVLEPSRPVTASDFRVVEVGLAPGVEAINADQQATLIGRTPRSQIAAGTVVSEAMFIDSDQVVPPGSVIVSAQLSAGAVPASLKVDDTVVVIDVTEAAAQVIGPARVFEIVRPDGDAGDVQVSLVVTADLQVPVVVAASGDVLGIGIVNS